MKPQRITFDKAMAVAGPAGTLQMRTDELAVACLGLPGLPRDLRQPASQHASLKKEKYMNQAVQFSPSVVSQPVSVEPYVEADGAAQFIHMKPRSLKKMAREGMGPTGRTIESRCQILAISFRLR
jgi:hypothetical protein